MEVLDSIPFQIDSAKLMEQAHVDPGSEDAAELSDLVDLAMQVGRPKAVYSMAFIEGRDGDSVRVGEVTFTSRTLSRNLEKADRVFPMIATCGEEMDTAFRAKGDILQEFWWDLIKTQLLWSASKRLDDCLRRRFRLDRTATMRPGSGDANVWPIEQQQSLFRLLGDVHGAIGVRLTESFLMVPNKTTSGILFPTEKDFRSCEVCHREKCPSRHAPFNSRLWEELQHE